LGCKPASTPLDPKVNLHQDDGPLHTDVGAYRRLVGRLLYLTTTRPNVSFAVQQLSQFVDKPTVVHFKTTQKVLKCLKGAPSKGLFFPRSSSRHLMGFSDAKWGRCEDSRRSVSGYCFFIGDSLVSWRSKKQSIVSKSSSESKYRALATATCKLQWLTFLLHDLKITCSRQPVLFCDNQSALDIVANPVFHERTKHLDIDCYVARERCQSGLMRLLPIASKDQTADMLTKALHPTQFQFLLSKLGMVDIYHPPS